VSLTEARIVTGEWTDPERAKIHLADYATKWINERPGLRPNTKALYEWLWNKHIRPRLGEVQLGKITTALVREWRADLLEDGVSLSVTAKSYRLLRAIFNTAVRRTASSRATRAGCALTRRAPPNGRYSPWPRCSTWQGA
jgi:hypothetical protein